MKLIKKLKIVFLLALFLYNLIAKSLSQKGKGRGRGGERKREGWKEEREIGRGDGERRD